jgi:hypothetical protein
MRSSIEAFGGEIAKVYQLTVISTDFRLSIWMSLNPFLGFPFSPRAFWLRRRFKG